MSHQKIQEEVTIYQCALSSVTDFKKVKDCPLLVFRKYPVGVLQNRARLHSVLNKLVHVNYRIETNCKIFLNEREVSVYILSLGLSNHVKYICKMMRTISLNECVHKLFLEQVALVDNQKRAAENYNKGDTCQSYVGTAWFDVEEGLFFSFSLDGIYITAQYLLKLSKQKLLAEQK